MKSEFQDARPTSNYGNGTPKPIYDDFNDRTPVDRGGNFLFLHSTYLGKVNGTYSKLQKAKQSDPKLRQEFESLANFVPHFKPILSGKEFTRKFFGQP